MSKRMTPFERFTKLPLSFLMAMGAIARGVGASTTLGDNSVAINPLSGGNFTVDGVNTTILDGQNNGSIAFKVNREGNESALLQPYGGPNMFDPDDANIRYFPTRVSGNIEPISSIIKYTDDSEGRFLQTEEQPGSDVTIADYQSGAFDIEPISSVFNSYSAQSSVRNIVPSDDRSAFYQIATGNNQLNVYKTGTDGNIIYSKSFNLNLSTILQSFQLEGLNGNNILFVQYQDSTGLHAGYINPNDFDLAANGGSISITTLPSLNTFAVPRVSGGNYVAFQDSGTFFYQTTPSNQYVSISEGGVIGGSNSLPGTAESITKYPTSFNLNSGHVVSVPAINTAISSYNVLSPSASFFHTQVNQGDISDASQVNSITIESPLGLTVNNSLVVAFQSGQDPLASNINFMPTGDPFDAITWKLISRDSASPYDLLGFDAISKFDSISGQEIDPSTFDSSSISNPNNYFLTAIYYDKVLSYDVNDLDLSLQLANQTGIGISREVESTTGTTTESTTVTTSPTSTVTTTKTTTVTATGTTTQTTTKTTTPTTTETSTLTTTVSTTGTTTRTTSETFTDTTTGTTTESTTVTTTPTTSALSTPTSTVTTTRYTTPTSTATTTATTTPTSTRTTTPTTSYETTVTSTGTTTDTTTGITTTTPTTSQTLTSTTTPTTTLSRTGTTTITSTGTTTDTTTGQTSPTTTITTTGTTRTSTSLTTSRPTTTITSTTTSPTSTTTSTLSSTTDPTTQTSTQTSTITSSSTTSPTTTDTTTVTTTPTTSATTSQTTTPTTTYTSSVTSTRTTSGTTTATSSVTLSSTTTPTLTVTSTPTTTGTTTPATTITSRAPSSPSTFTTTYTTSKSGTLSSTSTTSSARDHETTDSEKKGLSDDDISTIIAAILFISALVAFAAKKYRDNRIGGQDPLLNPLYGDIPMDDIGNSDVNPEEHMPPMVAETSFGQDLEPSPRQGDVNSARELGGSWTTPSSRPNPPAGLPSLRGQNLPQRPTQESVDAAREQGGLWATPVDARKSPQSPAAGTRDSSESSDDDLTVTQVARGGGFAETSFSLSPGQVEETEEGDIDRVAASRDLIRPTTAEGSRALRRQIPLDINPSSRPNSPRVESTMSDLVRESSV